MSRKLLFPRLLLVLTVVFSAQASPPAALRTGVAEHAFDHLGDIGGQAKAAAASGDNIIYCSGLGIWGYHGLPEESQLAQSRKDACAYIKSARDEGIRLAIGYVCATSIVGLNSFDRHWTEKFRSQFRTPPSEWRQQDKNGKPLPSWYGGEYRPACMNNPDWRKYEKNMVRMQLEAGCDGIFFDNPTVHPAGCYCPFCMEKFADFLAMKANRREKPAVKPSLDELRQQAVAHPEEFLEFRGTTARDFIADMRSYARTVKRGALITCNNSLNSSDALFSQSRTYGYNINEMSRTEDLVVVEDMSSQPRILANRQTVEYGPTYAQLHALSHGKPVVAVTIADADYHTAPDLMKLAMAEAAAHDASYLTWPTWPENQRQRMAAAVRPEADFLRQNQKFLNDTVPRCDVALFLCFRQWLKTAHCEASVLAAALTRENIQYIVSSEENFNDLVKKRGGTLPVVLLESRSVLNDSEKRQVAAFEKAGGKVVTANQPKWLEELKRAVENPSVTVQGPASIRVAVRDQGRRTIVHIYNLDVEKVSSYEDKVHPAENVKLKVRKLDGRIHSVRVLSADSTGSAFSSQTDGTVATITLPRLEIAAMLVIE